ncbi:phospholipase, partial [Pseudomonas sp. F1002]|nr:phospholipase [Pseudomonas sp. F1002]
EVVMRSEAMAKRVGDLHEQLWDGPYAKALEVTSEYPQPHPGKP